MEENKINYNEISERMGYDILIGANNGEEIRRANTTKPWKTDYEIYNPDQEPQPSTGNYLTFTALEDNSSVIMKCECEGYDSFPISVEYSLDNGNTWNECEFEYNDDLGIYIIEPIELNTDDSVMLRGNNTNLGNTGEDKYAYINFGMLGSIKASGDVTSLINNIGGDCELVNTNCYNNMFNGCSSLIEAPSLPSTILSVGCYNNMFNGCSSLIEAPELPATTLAEACYLAMFSGCTSLETAPELPATQLSDSCYYEMFKECNSLNYVKCLSTTPIEYVLSNDCLNNWLDSVSGEGVFIVNPSIKNDYQNYFSGGSSGIQYEWTDETGEFKYYSGVA